jgi:hypothetical protein
MGETLQTRVKAARAARGAHQGLQVHRRRLSAHLRIEWCNQEYEFDGLPLRA